MSGGAKKLLHAAAGTSAAGGSGLFVEDVFSTYLYTGNGATGQSIVNGIDLSGEGGLVWGKSREDNSNNGLYDTERGIGKALYSNGTGGQGSDQSGKGLTAFNNDGFTLGDDWAAAMNLNGSDSVAWTWRKAPGFFDIVTYTGNGTAGKTVAHNLGSVPKMIWVKRTDASGEWRVYHWRLGNDAGILLNDSGSSGSYAPLNNSTPTSSQFVLNDNANVNANSGTYVAYLFGEDAVFGEDGDEQICKIDRYNGTGTSGLKVDVGFEPQWILVKCNGNPWGIMDIMRGANGQAARSLQANSGSAEQTVGQYSTAAVQVTSTGFTLMTDDEGGGNANNTTYLYMAIRRPMKVPAAGTEVFKPTLGQASSNISVGFPLDMAIIASSSNDAQHNVVTRLQGEKTHLTTSSTAAQTSDNGFWDMDDMTTFYQTQMGGTKINYFFKRAPEFMDVVDYTGTGSSHAVTHNLNTTPELIIIKKRSEASYGGWAVYYGTGSNLILNRNHATGHWYSNAVTAAISTTFTVVDNIDVNDSGEEHTALLFATLADVSKVGSVSHSGTTNVDCGFSNGARFVLAKRTDAAGDWFVWDSVRGIISGNDPYLILNAANTAHVTNTDYIDPLSSGFTLSDDFTDGTYIFLAIA